MNNFSGDAGAYIRIRREINASADEMALDVIQQLRTKKKIIKSWRFEENSSTVMSKNFWNVKESKLDLCRTALSKINKIHPDVILEWDINDVKNHRIKRTTGCERNPRTYSPKITEIAVTFKK